MFSESDDCPLQTTCRCLSVKAILESKELNHLSHYVRTYKGVFHASLY